MKTKHLIIILSLMSFGVANSFAQFKPIFPGCADTSKLENFSQYLLEPSDPRMPRPKRKHYSDEEIQNLYYQGEVFMTPENGSIDEWRDFQNYKKVSYPEKNNQTTKCCPIPKCCMNTLAIGTISPIHVCLRQNTAAKYIFLPNSITCSRIWALTNAPLLKTKYIALCSGFFGPTTQILWCSS